MSLNVLHCRSCFRPVVWVHVGASGRRIPLDAVPGATGTLAIERARGPGRDPWARPVAVAHRFGREDLYTKITTCPDREQWRQRARETRQR